MSNKLKRIYVAATRQNDGKTFCTLGLINLFQQHFGQIGYIKPVGQQVQLINHQAIDKDASLMMDEFHLDQELGHMSPVAVPKGFTRDYLNNTHTQKYNLAQDIKKAFETTSLHKDVMIIEGTGHAGVGSVFGLSNASVASLLKAKVIIVTCAGIGKPIDEVALNSAVFRDHGIDVIGVIVNKVDRTKYDDINHYVRLGFKHQGIDVLGVIPYEPLLDFPKMRHIKKALNPQLINFSQDIYDSRFIESVYIPDEKEMNLSSHQNTLVLISAKDEKWMVDNLENLKQLGERLIILCTKAMPLSNAILHELAHVGIPVYLSEAGLYKAASVISQISVKLGREDAVKIKTVKSMIAQYVDFDLLSRKLSF